MATRRRLIFLPPVTLLFLLSCSTIQASGSASGNPFPVYDCMKPNVAFWETVYAKYPSTKGLIHDRTNLGIIYEVIDLLPEDQSGCEPVNKKRVNRTKEKYQRILLALASGKRPETTEEKRVLALFGSHPSPSVLKEAAESIRLQLCLKDRFIPGLIRSGACIGKIKKIFRSYGLPEDLAYLPHVESSFNYDAYSKFGAAGIWQFTQATGKRYMTIDYTVDERRDPIRSSHAAARYLRENYERLGSWPLAITAYNHGEGGVLRAAKKKGDYERIFKEYDGGRFGFASRNFYSEFMAARNIAKNYKRCFGNIPLEDEVKLCEVTMPGFAAVKDLSRHFQVDVPTLRKLNPALRPPVFEGRKYVPKGYKLQLPVNNGSTVKLAQRMPDLLFVDKQQRSRFYLVHKGDTMGCIARQHGVKLQDLIVVNGLGEKGVIYPGQNLSIPASRGKGVLLAGAKKVQSVGKSPRKRAGPEQEVAKALVKGPEPATKVAEAGEKKKTAPQVLASLTRAEREAAIEERTPRSAAERKPAPGAVQVRRAAMEPDALDDVPQPPVQEAAISMSVVIGNLQVADVRTKNGRTSGTIRVEAEETLGHYADWLRIPTRSVRKLNGLRIHKPIKLGQRLKIDLKRTSKDDFEEKRYEYHKEIQEDFFAAYKIEGTRLYRIKAGDNIWRLCQAEFDLPLWLIRRFNGTRDLNELELGQELTIPVVRKIEAHKRRGPVDTLCACGLAQADRPNRTQMQGTRSLTNEAPGTSQ
jgi:membrane-bound lytic murein transglycosylase D